VANGDQNRRTLRPAWHAWVCVLVIGLVLYNPFVGLFHAGDTLSYEKLARNRATLGSSELQHFSPVPDSTVQPDADVEKAERNVAELANTKQVQRGIVQHEALPQPAELLTGVWFRPPPAL
jgi:hypothetical protein